MLGTRTTHNLVTKSAVQNLQNSMSRSQMYSEQLTSGKRIQKPSDDPTGTISALQHRTDKAALEQHVRNADDGLGWLATSDSALQKAIAAARSAYTKIIQAANDGAAGEGSRKAIAADLTGIRDHLLSIANTEYGGRLVFGGTSGNTEVYETTGANKGDYVADAAQGAVNRQVAPNETVKVNTNAREVFGINGGARSFYQVFEDAAAALNTYDPATFGTSMDTAIEELQALQKNLTQGLTDVGARHARLEAVKANRGDVKLELQSRISNIESIDLAETVMNMQIQEVAHKAALGATARVMQPTLLDFLR